MARRIPTTLATRAAGGNVVPLRPAPVSTESIVQSVQDRSKQESQDLLARLKELNVILDQRHAERAQELLSVGRALDGQGLADLIEIGRRMAGRARA